MRSIKKCQPSIPLCADNRGIVGSLPDNLDDTSPSSTCPYPKPESQIPVKFCAANNGIMGSLPDFDDTSPLQYHAMRST